MAIVTRRQHRHRAPGEGVGEAADAVAADLGTAAVGVEQHHPGAGVVVALADQQPVGADPAAPVAHPPGQVGQLGRRQVDVEGDEEVVAESVVLDELQRVHVRERVDHARPHLGERVGGGGVDVDPAYAGVAAEPPLLTRGEPTRPRDDRRDGFVEADEAVEVVEQFLVAERLARRRRQSVGGQAGDLVEQAGGHHRRRPAARCARPGRHVASGSRSARRRSAETPRRPGRTS